MMLLKRTSKDLIPVNQILNSLQNWGMEAEAQPQTGRIRKRLKKRRHPKTRENGTGCTDIPLKQNLHLFLREGFCFFDYNDTSVRSGYVLKSDEKSQTIGLCNLSKRGNQILEINERRKNPYSKN